MQIHIFNPEHDMALAAHSPHWTSPHAGRQMRSDLEWIPALWAKEGDIIVVDDEESAINDYRRIKLTTAKKNITFSTLANLHRHLKQNTSIPEIKPWGWDMSVRGQLLRAGISASLMPDDKQIDDIRRCSSRLTTLELMPYLREGLHEVTCGDVMAAFSKDVIKQQLKIWNDIVIKTPWSCSGRGVRYVSGVIDTNTDRWIDKQISTQGCLMIEPLHEKVIDFGMEFSIINGQTQYLGLSLFDTVGGAYTGSILATEQEKMDMMTRYIDKNLLEEIQRRICTYTNGHLKGIYDGAFGVDMMVVVDRSTTSEKLLLNPCIELNLRRTMGHTALALSPQEPGHKQIMRIAIEGKHYHMRLFQNEEIFI